MGFQTTVNLTQGFGVQGEIIYDGPVRSAPWNLVSTPEANVIGATAYTVVSPGTDTTAGTATAGGTGVYCGILANPKTATFTGTIGTPTMTLPDDAIGELVTMGQITLLLTTTANPGDLLYFNNTTGVLSSIAPVTSFTGVITVTTGALATSLLTSGAIYVGMPIAGTNVPAGTIILSGSGTSWVTNCVVAVASTIMTGPSAAPSGSTLVPKGKVILRASAANALAICELTD